MGFTLLHCSNRGLRSVRLSGRRVAAIITVLAVIPLFTGVLGFKLAHLDTSKSEVSEATLQQWKKQLLQQQSEIDRAKQISEQQLNALTARLALLQAHIRRLDAAGLRVTEVAGIETSEFDFSQTPAVGGPDQPNEAQPSPTALPDFNRTLDQLNELVAERQHQLDVLESVLLDKHLGAEKYISGRPIKKGWLSSYFGTRTDPFHGRPAWHAGIDFAGKEGGEVVSTAAGVVSFVGERYGYGLLIEVAHGDGLVTRYAHNKEALVQAGEIVAKGQTLAKMGSTGRSTGPHVHYEILKNGRQIDPIKYVNRRSR